MLGDNSLELEGQLPASKINKSRAVHGREFVEGTAEHRNRIPPRGKTLGARLNAYNRVDVPHNVAVPGDDKKSGFKQSVKVTIEDKEGQKHTLRLPLPYRPKGEMLAVAETFQGGSRLQGVCDDGKRRMGRIPGKLRRRMWVRENDLLIIVPWSFQDSKADVKFSYTATQSANLTRQNLIPEILDIY